MSEMPVSMLDVESNVGLKTEDVGQQTEFIDHKLYMSERIQEMEQEIKEVKLKLEDMQQKNDALNKRLFMLENLKSKDTAAAFYSGFPNWDTFRAIYKINILIPEIGDRISPISAS